MSSKKRQRRNNRQNKWRELEEGKSISELIELYQDQMMGRVINELAKHDFEDGDIHDIAMHLFELASDGAQHSWSDFRGGSSVRTWLFKIQHNKIVEFWRHQKVNRRFVQEKRYRLAQPRPHEDPAWLSLKTEQIDQVRHTIASLPSNMKVVIEMLSIKEMDRKDVCKRLGLSRSALDTRFCRAKAELRRRLAARGFGRDG